MKYISFLIGFFSLFLFIQESLATHNRAGEITFRQINNLSIEVTITTYTKASSTDADRDSLELFWGDNTSEYINRDNSKTKFAANDVKINYYIAQHTYPGPATYTMFFTDPNRVSTILNINYPNSVDIPFFLSTTFTLLNQQFQGQNNSVILLQPPLDIACAGRIFTHNPNGYDLDGDSLVYEFATPLQSVNLPVPNYKLPDEIAPGATNNLTINSRTGEIIWNAPVLQGEYNIAIRILEYRKGQLINSVLRDMQILVRSCLNNPPSVVTEEELCVVAGEKIELNVLVDDINNGQKVKLFATGGPFSVVNPAELITPNVFTTPQINAKLIWQTNCNHISKDFYQVVFRAVDNYFGDSSGLATLKTVRIKVVGPDPKNLKAIPVNKKIVIRWDENYICNEKTTTKFSGFAVYRSITSFPFLPDTCNPGLENSGYTKIAIGIKQKDSGTYFYEDINVVKGLTYCYRVVAEFSLFTTSGIPFAKTEGLPSEEVCAQLSRELPLITKVSVLETDETIGEIQVSWTKPLLDSSGEIQFPPPYTFEFYRSTSLNNFELIPEKTISSVLLTDNFDTLFFDKGLNTKTNTYYYRIRMLCATGEVGISSYASSVFAVFTPSDKKAIISWTYDVPWSNYEYDIFRIENGNSIYLGTSREDNYIDNDLTNKLEYCYRVLTKGSYNIEGLKDTLFNFSQIVCGIPVDNVAPCPTVLTVQNPCDLIKSGVSLSELFNKLEWENVQDLCSLESKDAFSYHIYYSPDKISEFEKIMTIQDVEVTSYNHFSETGLAGCYFVTSVDSLGNESDSSNIVCLENCPLYLLPNTFTPNADNKNDLYKPLTNYFIEKVEFIVYNQWGNQVYSTHDPKLNWNGNNYQGKELAEGVYHYTCRIFVRQIDGRLTEEPSLSGFIQIFR
ncbi:MAG: gliding motility-associated C-terminal domain-containing protein [Saprospiraceae bacterium]|nr:gliding motility-associated C-terminal domain-containing protein [Saprospiraceae bacterium]MBK6565830.1 gliding motility-associated C-terminal domain-containing protein [Saprospiraceae bacterium]